MLSEVSSACRGGSSSFHHPGHDVPSAGHRESEAEKVHVDGCNQLPYLMGQQPPGPRRESAYFNDDGDLAALGVENWKVVFEEQCAQGMLRVRAEPFTKLRIPKFFDPQAEPYERADIAPNL